MAGSSRSTFLQRGLPLVVTTVVGWFGLSQFVKAKLDVQDSQRAYSDDVRDLPVEKQRAKSFNLDQELERIKEHRSLFNRRENLVNKEVPR